MPVQRSEMSSKRSSLGAGISTRGAVNDIFRATETLLGGFANERKHLHRSVQDKIDELNGIREDDTHSLRADLKDYADELRASSRERKHETQEYIDDLRQSVLRKIEELHQLRERDTQLIQDDLRSFVEEMRENVVQIRAELRRELGSDEPVFRRKRATQNQPEDAKRTVGTAVTVAKGRAFKAAGPQQKSKITSKAAVRASSGATRHHHEVRK
jgi:hypothetical protein